MLVHRVIYLILIGLTSNNNSQREKQQVRARPEDNGTGVVAQQSNQNKINWMFLRLIRIMQFLRPIEKMEKVQISLMLDQRYQKRNKKKANKINDQILELRIHNDNKHKEGSIKMIIDLLDHILYTNLHLTIRYIEY